MKFSELVMKYKLKNHIAVGLRIHLKVENETELSEDRFANGYKEFLKTDPPWRATVKSKKAGSSIDKTKQTIKEKSL